MPLQGYEQLRRRFVAISGSQGSTQVMRMLGLAAVREQKLLVRRKTGTTGRTIRVGNVSPTSVTTIAGGAAGFLEDGTRPHEIRPKNKRALFFASQHVINERFGTQASSSFTLSGRLRSGAMRKFGNAAFVLTTLVDHPGTRPYPFMVPGAKLAVQKTGLTDAIVSKWNEAA